MNLKFFWNLISTVCPVKNVFALCNTSNSLVNLSWKYIVFFYMFTSNYVQSNVFSCSHAYIACFSVTFGHKSLSIWKKSEHFSKFRKSDKNLLFFNKNSNFCKIHVYLKYSLSYFAVTYSISVCYFFVFNVFSLLSMIVR